jgi:hypothetical protein
MEHSRTWRVLRSGIWHSVVWSRENGGKEVSLKRRHIHDITFQKTLIFMFTVITSNLTQHQLGPHVTAELRYSHLQNNTFSFIGRQNCAFWTDWSQWLDDSMEESFSKANNSLGSQEIAHSCWKRRIHCCANSHLPLVLSLWRIQSAPLQSISLGWILIQLSYLCSGLQSRLFFSGFPSITIWKDLAYPIRDTRHKILYRPWYDQSMSGY